MAALDSQQTLVPYENTRDCSKGFCSFYCPQWCYIVFPPPPPLGFERDGSGPNFSPLVIAIIAILVSAFLLVSYHVIVSKYCGNMDSTRRLQGDQDDEFNNSRSPSRPEPWQALAAGLDEALIKTITVYKYKKGDGLVEGTDCSVCLSEFEENENLRLLPKCSHAFHLPCIDMWLKSHSNCPLCRANVVPQLPPLVLETNPDRGSYSDSHPETDGVVSELEDLERGEEEPHLVNGGAVPKSPVERESRIEIREGDFRPTRRSFSMDAYQNRVSIADVLVMSVEENYQVNINMICESQAETIGPPKRGGNEQSNMGHRNRVLNCVMSPTAMKRSSSSGRFSLNTHGRGRNSALPI